MRSPETSRTLSCLLAHLRERLLVRVEVELRDEAKPAHESQRILGEARRRDRAQAARLEVGLAAVRVDERPVGEPARHRVDREVAARRSSSTGADGSTTISKSCRPGPVETLAARRRQLDPGGHAADLRVARVEPHADRPAGDDELLDAAVRLERARRPSMSTPGNEEVGVLRVEPEQLVAHRAADDVRVEPERARRTPRSL